MIEKKTTLILVKVMFLLLGVLFISDGLAASGWRRITDLIIGGGLLIPNLIYWKRKDYPFDPAEPVFKGKNR